MLLCLIGLEKVISGYRGVSLFFFWDVKVGVPGVCEQGDSGPLLLLMGDTDYRYSLSISPVSLGPFIYNNVSRGRSYSTNQTEEKPGEA